MPSKYGREFDIIRDDGSDDDLEWTFERETHAPAPAEPSPAKLITARAIYALRRFRDRMAEPHADLFSDPAWDLLLDLYVARGESRDVSDARARVAACAAESDVRHCLQALQERGLMSRVSAAGERGSLSLTLDGIDLVERLLPEKLG